MPWPGKTKGPGRPACLCWLFNFISFSANQSLPASDFKSTDLLSVYATLVPAENPVDARFSGG
jgi:hypothetical protein